MRWDFIPRYKIDKVELENRLDPEAYYLSMFGGSEQPNTGKYQNNFKRGSYNCIVCDEYLFASKNKMNFKYKYVTFNKAAGDVYEYRTDDMKIGDLYKLTEAKCKNCGSHLGDIMYYDKKSKTGISYLINSSSLKFVPGFRVKYKEPEFSGSLNDKKGDF